MTIEINLNELGRVQYLTEVLPEIPTNTILYKKLTGLGATYGEITAKRNSIIIEPLFYFEIKRQFQATGKSESKNSDRKSVV